MRLPAILLVLYLALFVILAIEPHDRATWWAENIPVLAVVILLVVSYPLFKFSAVAYVMMWLFLCYHTIGGHFTFALVPFEWGNTLLNTLHQPFLLPEGRNNFDRLGHFLVGVFAYPLAELFLRKHWAGNRYAAAFVGVIALGFWAAAYEVIEMYFAVLYGGESGAAFLGSQGDEWDAQKDMLMDILGATVAAILFLLLHRSRRR